MTRGAVVLAALVTAGCGSDRPTAPAPPPIPMFPNMLGGWNGTQSDTWVSTTGDNTGGRTCNEAWLITSQSGGGFSGAFQRTPGNSTVCARSGTVSGNVLVSGGLEFRYSDVGVSGGCPLVSGDPTSRGVLSTAGNITAGTIVVIRCPSGSGTIDLRFTIGLTMSRR